MVIEKSAVAGTLESSDAQVTVEPAEGLGFQSRAVFSISTAAR